MNGMSRHTVVLYDVNDRVTSRSELEGDMVSGVVYAEQLVSKTRHRAAIEWHSVTPSRCDGRVSDHGRYLGGVMVIDSSATGNHRVEDLIPSIGTSYSCRLPN